MKTIGDLKNPGTFIVKNLISDQVWSGYSEYPLSYTVSNMLRNHKWRCGDSQLNLEIFRDGLENFVFEVVEPGYFPYLQRKSFIPAIKSELYPLEVRGIYAIMNTVNDKVYVGASDNIYTRVCEHIVYVGTRGKIRKAVELLGKENFYPVILEKIDNMDLLNERELHWIDKLDSIQNGYNTTRQGWQSRGIRYYMSQVASPA